VAVGEPAAGSPPKKKVSLAKPTGGEKQRQNPEKSACCLFCESSVVFCFWEFVDLLFEPSSFLGFWGVEFWDVGFDV